MDRMASESSPHPSCSRNIRWAAAMRTIARIRALGSQINYRHPLTLAIASTAVACLILVAFFVIWQAYANRPMRKSYPALKLPEIGLIAALRTERIEDSVQYIFHAKALSDATKERLDEVIQKRNHDSLKFSISLEDDAGFELCQADVSWHPNLGPQGKVVELIGKGFLSYCPTSRYSRVSKWNMTFSYPLVTENLSPVIVQNDQSSSRGPSPHKDTEQSNTGRAAISVLSEDVLTGADVVSGGVETLSGRSFKVTREAEKTALTPWRPTDKLAIACDKNACLITDENNGQSVHARLVSTMRYPR